MLAAFFLDEVWRVDFGILRPILPYGDCILVIIGGAISCSSCLPVAAAADPLNCVKSHHRCRVDFKRSAIRYRKITLDAIGKLRRLILIVLPDQIFASFCDLAEIEEVLDLLLSLFLGERMQDYGTESACFDHRIIMSLRVLRVGACRLALESQVQRIQSYLSADIAHFSHFSLGSLFWGSLIGPHGYSVAFRLLLLLA